MRTPDTMDADHLPVSACSKCRRPGKISSCTRINRSNDEVYEMVCAPCRIRWEVKP